MYCSNCGKSVEAGDRFCSGCGSGTGAAPLKEKGAGFTPELKKTVFVLAGLLVVLLVVFLVLSPFSGGGQSTPQQTLDSFFNALKRGNTKQMIDLIDPQIIAEMEEWGTTMEMMTMQMQFIAQAIEVLSYQVLDVEIRGDRAEVQVYMKISNKMYGFGEIEEDTNYIEMVFRNGKWYIGEDFF